MKTLQQRLEIEKKFQFEYMYLARMKEDIKYYWGYGKQYTGILYCSDYQEHVNEMIRRWKELPYKPIWLRPHELIAYKHQTEPFFIVNPNFLVN